MPLKRSTSLETCLKNTGLPSQAKLISGKLITLFLESKMGGRESNMAGRLGKLNGRENKMNGRESKMVN